MSATVDPCSLFTPKRVMKAEPGAGEARLKRQAKPAQRAGVASETAGCSIHGRKRQSNEWQVSVLSSMAIGVDLPVTVPTQPFAPAFQPQRPNRGRAPGHGGITASLSARRRKAGLPTALARAGGFGASRS